MTLTINGIRYHDDSFRQTAQAIRIMNPSARNYPEMSLIDHMRRAAEMLRSEGQTYCSALGYVVTLFHNDQGVGAEASVSAYTALKYAEGRA